MNFNKTHSKSDMITLCKQLDVELDKKLNKNQIKNEITELINNHSDKFKFNKNDFNIKNIGDFVIHLQSENLECKIDSIEKEIVMAKAKKIIHFGKCKYNIYGTDYNDMNEIFSDCIYISKYGFIPSVRRACKIHNDCLFKVDHVNPQLSHKIQRDMNQKKQMKSITNYNIKINHGEHWLYFD